MKRILVHFHIYYHDQVDYFIEKMKNINGVSWDLIITYSRMTNDTENKLRAFKSDVTFIATENIGYDIWPFIKVIKSINLDDYDYIIKLHTKRSVKRCAANVIPMKGYDWRNSLVDGVLYTSEYFNNLIQRFDKDPKIGMISNLKTYSKRNWESYSGKVEEELNRLGLRSNGNHFCMGTMFIAKTSVLKPLQSDKIIEDYFSDTVKDTSRDFTSAHYYERLLSVLPQACGLKHITCSPRLKEAIIIKTIRILEKPVRWIFGIEKKGEDKRKFIRILGFEFFIEKPHGNI